MPSGVLAASATSPARSPLVTHIFVPSITYSSPSGFARQRRAWASLPASGSERLNAARTSPVAMVGRKRLRCSSVPYRLIRFAAIMWVFSTPDSDIQP